MMRTSEREKLAEKLRAYAENHANDAVNQDVVAVQHGVVDLSRTITSGSRRSHREARQRLSESGRGTPTVKTSERRSERIPEKKPITEEIELISDRNVTKSDQISSANPIKVIQNLAVSPRVFETLNPQRPAKTSEEENHEISSNATKALSDFHQISKYLKSFYFVVEGPIIGEKSYFGEDEYVPDENEAHELKYAKRALLKAATKVVSACNFEFQRLQKERDIAQEEKIQVESVERGRDENKLRQCNMKIKKCNKALENIIQVTNTVGRITEKAVRNNFQDSKELDDLEREQKDPIFRRVVKGFLGALAITVGVGLILFGVVGALSVSGVLPPSSPGALFLGAGIIKLGALAITGGAATLAVSIGVSAGGLATAAAGCGLFASAVKLSNQQEIKDNLRAMQEPFRRFKK